MIGVKMVVVWVAGGAVGFALGNNGAPWWSLAALLVLLGAATSFPTTRAEGR